ncbi:MAG: PrsW family intramembrane metalloprotease [Candidatus Microbacterium stercoravium]
MTYFDPGSDARAFSTRRRQEGAPITEAPLGEPHLPVAPPPRLLKQGRTVWPWVWFVVAFFAVATLAFFVLTYGAVTPVLASILAFIPFGGVLLALMWLDRWEPEPKGLMIAATAWGAFVAVALTLAVGLIIAIMNPVASQISWFGSVVQAPIVEELLKCSGILVVLAMGRRALDGALDGIVYGGLIGAGFAFVENIKYFVEALAEGGVGGLTAVFFLRAVLSPFAHIMFTACCGFAVGLAVRRAKPVAGAWFLGLLAAMLLHAFWNGSAEFAGFFLPYLLLQIPLFVVFLIVVLRIRRAELQIRRERLQDYVVAGWFTAQEADMLSTPAGRRAGLAWARSIPGDRRSAMQRFIIDGARLAWARQRAITGKDPQAATDERALLQRMMLTRTELLAPIGAW